MAANGCLALLRSPSLPLPLSFSLLHTLLLCRCCRDCPGVRPAVRVYVCVCVLVTLIALIERLFYACHAHLFVY